MSRDDGQKYESLAAALAGLKTHSERLRTIDPYEFFGLWRGCGRDEAEDAFFSQTRRHHPDRVASFRDAEVNALANDVFMKVKGLYEAILREEPTPEPSRPRPAAEPSRSAPHSFSQRPLSVASRPSSSRGVSASSSSRSSVESTPQSESQSGLFARRPSVVVSGPGKKEGANLFSRRPSTTKAVVPPAGGEENTFSRRPSTARVSAPSEPLFTRRPSTVKVQVPRSGPVAANPSQGSEAAKAPLAPSAKKVEGSASGEASLGAPSKQSLRDAQTRYREGLRLLKAQAFEKARVAFAEVASVTPEDGRVAAYLAWTEFLCDKSRASESREKLKKLKKESDAATDALFFLGKLELQEKNLRVAQRHFEEASKLDGKNVDIQRELRLIKMRSNEGEKENAGGFFKRLFSRKIKK